MYKEKRGIAASAESGADILINAIAAAVAYLLVAHLYGTVIAVTDGGSLLFILLLLVFLSVYYRLMGVYEPIPRYAENRLLSRIVFAEVISLPIILTVEAFLLDDGEYIFASRWTAVAAVISTILLVAKKHLIISAVRYLRRQNRLQSRIAVIGDNRESAELLLREVDRLTDSGVCIVGSVGVDLSERGIPHLGELGDATRVIDGILPDAVIFALSSYEREWLIDTVNRADDRCARVYFLPVIHGYFRSSSQVNAFGMLPLVNAHATPLDSIGAAFIKRAVDVFGAIALVAITLPVMLFAMIGVKLTSRGPAIFRQTRVGVGGRPFTMYKLRSMRVNDDSDTSWSRGRDSRKTRFGNFLRRTSIDELPQLFNVLRGDMSLVGPRPEIPHFVDKFRRTVPLYMVKHYVKPGMTGLAQIKGLRGDTSIEDRIAEDIYYIENWSLALDISILLKTPFAALNKSEVYGEGNDE